MYKRCTAHRTGSIRQRSVDEHNTIEVHPTQRSLETKLMTIEFYDRKSKNIFIYENFDSYQWKNAIRHQVEYGWTNNFYVQ